MYPTYVVVQGQVEPSDLCRGHHRHFESRGEAEEERTSRMLEAERLAALTEADIREVQVPTLADILERDAYEIDALRTEFYAASHVLHKLKEQVTASIASEIAALETKAAQDLGLPQLQARFETVEKAYHDAIHYDELLDKAVEMMEEEHGSDCWPDSDCRVAGECTYEPEDIEEFLEENAEEFEIEPPNEPASENCSSQAA